MYKHIGRGPVVRISRFQVTISCYYCHYQSPVSSVQSPESREHNIAIHIHSSAVNARVRTPATEIASSFSHFAIWHFAFCIVCLCVCVWAKERRDQITNWYLALL